ncbi:hypothetical protein DM860_017557 [Cuscuta australis]|uniref:Uncharacterized protein n=1 Tax=Cuscuta australis TaxID=267555 RepID=A0A328DU30_9ASTE|nr:hypothetical protein DM860_017557 [Cuscuta australis]
MLFLKDGSNKLLFGGFLDHLLALLAEYISGRGNAVWFGQCLGSSFRFWSRVPLVSRGCLATARTTQDRLPDPMWLFRIDWLVLEGGLLNGIWRCTWESNTLDERSWTVFWGNDWTAS